MAINPSVFAFRFVRRIRDNDADYSPLDVSGRLHAAAKWFLRAFIRFRRSVATKPDHAA